VAPVIEPGWDGIAVTETLSVLTELLPHELFALTVTDPPELPAVAVMDVLVEEPVQPEGNVHV
jgi:hypothetical protein